MNDGNQVKWVEYDGTHPVAKNEGLHVWSIRAGGEYTEFQSDAEKIRTANISDEATRRDYAASQGGLRRILAAYRQEDPRRINIQRAVHGKPYVEDGPAFNLSHTRNQTFVAISRGEVGLDVEAADRRVRAVELGRKFFTAAEQSLLGGTEEERNAWFLRLWVCKEAMVKLSGDGIYHGLRDAQIMIGGGSFTHGQYRGRKVHLQELRPAPGLLAAVATWENDQVNSFFRI